MNLIKAITTKYHGTYNEEPLKSTYTPSGKYSFQPQVGTINLSGSVITIKLNEVLDAVPVAEPYRITLHLKKSPQKPLSIFARNSLSSIRAKLLPSFQTNIPKALWKQFSFQGEQKIIQQIVSDQTIAQQLLDETIFISISCENPNQLVLTPAYGIEDIEQFDKYVSILTAIESKL